MENWVCEKERHVKKFEDKVTCLGFSIAKSVFNKTDYADPEVAKLWDFYSFGVQNENAEWQSDFS